MLKKVTSNTNIDKELENLQKDIAVLNQSLKLIGPKVRQASNVHSITGELGNEYRKIFSAIDDKYKLSNTTKKLETVIQEIQKFCSSEYYVPNKNLDSSAYIKEKRYDTTTINAVNTVLGSIQKQVGSNPDGETNINSTEILIRVWSLVRTGNIEDCGLIIDNLRDNILTKGGCIPGIVGRLVHPYMFLIQQKLIARFQQLQQRKLFVMTKDTLNNNDFNDTKFQRISKKNIEEENKQLNITKSLSKKIFEENQKKEMEFLKKEFLKKEFEKKNKFKKKENNKEVKQDSASLLKSFCTKYFFDKKFLNRVREWDGYTPITYLIFNADKINKDGFDVFKVLEALIEFGANISKVNNFNLTPLQIVLAHPPKTISKEKLTNEIINYEDNFKNFLSFKK